MVAEAAREAIERLLRGGGHEAVLATLLRSSKHADLRLVCRILASRARRDRLDLYRRDLDARRFNARAQAICAIGSLGSQSDIGRLEARLRRVQRRELQVCAWGLATCYQRNGSSARLRLLLRARNEDTVLGTLAAIDDHRGRISIGHLLAAFSRFPEEAGAAILRSVRPQDRQKLRSFLRSASLEPATRDILMALARVGDVRDVRFALKLIASHAEEVRFWNVPRVAALLANKSDRSILGWLGALTKSEEFWRYFGEDRAAKPLPVLIHENLYLFKRLAGSCLASVCGRAEWPLLRRLLFHEYWNIQVAAGVAIAEFAGEPELNELLADARANPKRLERFGGDSGIMSALCTIDEKVQGSALTS